MAQLDLLQLLSQNEIFAELGPEELIALSAHCRLQQIRRGEVLFHAGSPATHVYMIMFGSTKLVRSNAEGRERIVHLLLSGELFGAAVALQRGMFPVSAVSLEHTGVIEIAAPTFKTVFMKHPKIGQTLVAQMGERMLQAHADRVMSFDSVDKRVAAFLTDLLHRSCSRFGPTTRIPVPLTRQDIADRVGTTVETVIRILSDWSKENLVLTEKKQIEIPDTEKLCQAVGISVSGTAE